MLLLLTVQPGSLVGSFTGYFSNPPTATQADFQAECNRLSLYMFLLFIGKFILTYINKVSYYLPTIPPVPL